MWVVARQTRAASVDTDHHVGRLDDRVRLLAFGERALIFMGSVPALCATASATRPQRGKRALPPTMKMIRRKANTRQWAFIHSHFDQRHNKKAPLGWGLPERGHSARSTIGGRRSRRTSVSL
jgi:hypothetical protein